MRVFWMVLWTILSFMNLALGWCIILGILKPDLAAAEAAAFFGSSFACTALFTIEANK